MGRYSRAIYGSGKYGLDLWTEKSVEPMAADIEVDNVFSHSSSFTNDWGECVYDRVQVSWLAPQGVDRSVLMRSNLGYPTGPTDPFAATLLDSSNAVRTNLVTNPGFEQTKSDGIGTPNWVVGSGQAGSMRSTDWAASGTASLKLAYTGSGWTYVTWSPTGVNALQVPYGTTSLTLGVTVNNPGAAKNGGTSLVECYDSAGTKLTTPGTTRWGTIATGTGRYVTTITGIPEGTVYVRPWFLVGFQADGVYLDQMTVEAGTTTGTPFDGSTPGYGSGDGHRDYSWTGGVNDSTSVELVTGAVDKGTTKVTPWTTDPFERTRIAYLDRNVEPGREYFYSVWTYVASAKEWIESGRAMVTTSSDHGMLNALRAAMPAYMWNVHGGPGDGIDVLPDADPENHFGRFLQGMAWDLDKTLTKVDLMRQVWDPQRTPAVVLDDAISMYGLPNEPALGARASRALLANAAEITGERGSLLATGLLVESLTGFATDLQVGSNLICSTDESSFEGMAVVGGGNQTVVSGTGRWYFTNATKTRVSGDITPAPGGGQVQIARTPNSDDDWGAGVVTQFQGQQMLSGYRYGLRLAPKDVNKDTSMTLGERIKVTKLTGLGGTLAEITTAWVHGLEVGDKVSLTLDGGASSGTVTVLAVLDNFNVRVDVAGTPAFVRDPAAPATPADGYLFGGMIPVYQGVPVKALKQYSLVGKFQGATGATNFSLKVSYWNRFGSALGSVTASPSAGLAAMPAWSTSYNSGSAPAWAVSATLTVTLTKTGAAQSLGVDSLMLKPGGTPFNANQPYETDTAYDGSVDYTYEDARLLTITINPTKTPSNGPIPVSILADHRAVVEARLTAILAAYLPAGTAFVIRWSSDQQ